DGEISIEPLLAAVKAEGAKQLEQQETIVRNALENVLAGLNTSQNQESVIEAILAQTENLNRQQESLQDLKTQTESINQQQDALSRDIAGLNESLPSSTLSAEIQSQIEEVLEQVSEVSIEPILAALQSQSQQLAENQSKALQQALGDIAVRGSDGEISIEPLLAAVKAEGAKQLEQQETIISDAFDSVVAQLGQSSSNGEVIEAIDRLTERQAFLNENIVGLASENNRDDTGSAFSLEKTLDTLKKHSVELAEQQRSEMHAALSKVVNDLNESFSLDNLIDVLQNGTEQLMESQKQLFKNELSGLSLEPLLAALSSQSEELAQSQSRILHETLSEVAVNSDEGRLAIEPLLATMKAENTRQLERQEEAIRSILSEVVRDITDIKTETHNLSERLDSGSGPNAHIVEAIIETVHTEAEAIMLNQQTTIRELLDQANFGSTDGVGLNQVVDTVKDELAKLTSLQENFVREAFSSASMDSAGLISMEPLIDAVQNQTAYLADTLQETIHNTLSKRDEEAKDSWSLTPVLDAIREQSKELATNQSRAMQDILAEMTIPHAGNEPVLETLISSIVDVVKAESERVLAQQNEIVREAMGSVVASVDDVFSDDTVLKAIRTESNRLFEQMEAGQHTENTSLETILGALQDQGNQILESQANILHDSLNSVGSHGGSSTIADLESVVTAVRLEGERLLQKQSDSVREAILSASSDLNGGSLTPEYLLDTIRTEMGRLIELVENQQSSGGINLEPVITAIQQESMELSESLGSVLNSVMADSASRNSDSGLAIQPILEEIRDSGNRMLQTLETASISEQLSDVIRTENEKLLDKLSKQVTMGPVLEMLQNQGEIVAAQQSEAIRETMSEMMDGGGITVALERVMETIQTEGSNIIEQISKQVTLAPIAKSMEEYMEKVSAEQFNTLQTTMTDVAANYAKGQMDFDPIIMVLRQEGEKVAERISNQLSSSNILEILRSEVGQLVESQAKQLESALAKITIEAGAKLDLEPLLDTLNSNSIQLSRELVENSNIEPIITAIKDESERLLATQSELLEKAINNAVEESGQHMNLQPILIALREESQHLIQELYETTNMDSVIEAVKLENARLLQGQNELIDQAISRAVLESADSVDLKPVLEEIKTSTKQLGDTESLLNAVKAENARLLQGQNELIDQAISRAVLESADSVDLKPILEEIKTSTKQLGDTEPLINAVKAENARLLESQTTLMEKAISLASMEKGQDAEMQLRISSMKEESKRLAQELEEKTNLETVLASVREETEKLVQKQTELVDFALSKAIKESGNNFDLKPILEEIRASSRQLADTEPLLNAIKIENAQLFESQSAFIEETIAQAAKDNAQEIDMQPVMSAIQNESSRQIQELGSRIDQVAIESGQKLDIEPIINAVKSESELLTAELRSGKREEREKRAELLNAITSQSSSLQQVIANAVDSLRHDLTPKGLLETIKTESNRIASTLEAVIKANSATTTRRELPQAISPKMVKDVVHSETARLETLLDKNLKTTAKLVEQSKRPLPVSTPIPAAPAPATPVAPVAKSAPTTDRPKWALSTPGQVYSDVAVAVQPTKPLTPLSSLKAEVKEIHWGEISSATRTEIEAAIKGIDGKSLLELMKSMKQYLTEQFGEQSDYLTKSIQELIVRIEQNHSISEPEVIALLREIGDRSSLIMASYNPDVPRVVDLDKGFLKSAKALQKQVDELAISRPGMKSARSETLSNSLDPDNSRQTVFHQFIAKKVEKKTDIPRVERLANSTSIDKESKPAVEVETKTKAPTPAPTKRQFVPAEPISVDLPTSAFTQAKVVPAKPISAIPPGSQPNDTKVVPASPIAVAPPIAKERAKTKQEIMWQSSPAQSPLLTTVEERRETDLEPEPNTKPAVTAPAVAVRGGKRKPNEPANLTPRSVTASMKESFFNSFLNKN
ncbi:MAG: hypothetical protein HQL70_00700, partial [Magnetococcales bacterium]|nr:hypothetical protein [Magnetococcales bacterium]